MSSDALTRDLAVLGGTGFVGRHFVAAATRQGRRVRMLFRAAETDTETDTETAAATRDAGAPVVHVADGREGPGSLLVDYAYGGGRIVVLSDPYVVSNAGVNRADNLFLAVNVATGGRKGRVAFDEFHHGYGETRNQLFAYFGGTPVLWMFAQGALVALALVWTSGRRFARPLPAPRTDRRSKLEFVSSMAELQHRARAYDLAVENIYQRTRRALARYGGLPATAAAAQIAERVAARSGRDRARIESLLRECEDAAAGAPLGARRALALARALRDLERDLGVLMRSREIRQAGAR
jgi:NmrA-like family